MTRYARPAGALFRRAPDVRLELARRHVGENVTVVDDLMRDGSSLHEHTGQVIAVAGVYAHATDVIVLRRPGLVDLAIPLARVRAIDPARLCDARELHRRTGGGFLTLTCALLEGHEGDEHIDIDGHRWPA
jgi:hypothetical protein